MISEQECRQQHKDILEKLTTIDINQKAQKEETERHGKDINELYDKYNDLNVKVSDNTATFYKVLVDKVDLMKNEVNTMKIDLLKIIEEKLDNRTDKWFRMIEVMVMLSSMIVTIWIATVQK